jgi:hypothetical protein
MPQLLTPSPVLCAQQALTTQEAEIRRTVVLNQPRQIVCKTKKRAGGMAQEVGPEFKPQYHKRGREREVDRRQWLIPVIILATWEA